MEEPTIKVKAEDNKKEVIGIKAYRSEWKYSLTNQELSLLKSRISKVMDLDPHTPKERKIFNSFIIF